ncbi:unnamed protein product [Blepharisma stoltei]|uniref:Sec1-like protein n=1 Tax=Blepharisma stoltei TaxID=1481888 RepID=A0AAU9KCC7_9CILI|nr:unnamed protein product [Blepharisma stoltei]
MDQATNSLYNLTRDRILEGILGEMKKTASYLILVVDQTSLSILNSIATVLDVTERGISVIEQLEKSRKPMPDIEAIYFVIPSTHTVKLLVEDYSHEPMYRSAHLFFTSDVNDSLMRFMANSSLYNYVKTFKEVNCEFSLCGQDAFSLERPGILGNLYMSNPDERSDLIISMAKQVSHICSVLKELPSVCYQSSSPQARELGLEIEQQIELLYRKLPEFEINDNRATLIVLDRKFDMTTPIAHDVHYEAMLKDLLNVSHDGKVKYESSDNSNVKTVKDAVLNEIDPLWVKYRYEEVDDAQKILGTDLQEFRAQNQEIEVAQQQQEIDDMKVAAKVVSNLSEYNDMVSRFALHSFLIDKCLQQFINAGIKEITEIEQILMTGIDTQKNEVKEDKIIERIVRLISTLSNPKEKLRLSILATIAMDLKERDRKAITEHLSANQIMILTKLQHLGIDLQNQLTNKTMKRIDKESVKLLKSKITEIQKIFCYAVPKLSEILDLGLNGQLDPNIFEFGRKGGPSFIEQREAAVGSLRRKSALPRNSVHSKRVIIFILGGVSLAELRFVKSHPEAHIIIGGSRVMTPDEFIDDISNIDKKSKPEEEKLDHDEIHIDLDFR